jgi:glycosyltransferase involved in cell wall biosynthesis
MPKASVIIPAYNAAEYIGATIESVLAQTFSDFECIIIDDGSTDNTVRTVKGYSDSRIKIMSE